MDINKKISNDELNILREKYKDDNVMHTLLSKDGFIENLNKALNSNYMNAERILDIAQKEGIAFPEYLNSENKYNNEKSAEDFDGFVNITLTDRYKDSSLCQVLVSYAFSKYEESMGKSGIRAYASERAEEMKLAEHFNTLSQKYDLECYDKEFLNSLHTIADTLDIPFARELTNMDNEKVIDYNLDDKLVRAYLEEYPMNGYLLSNVCDNLSQEINELQNNIPENMLSSRDENGSLRDVLGAINSKLEEISKTCKEEYKDYLKGQTELKELHI